MNDLSRSLWWCWLVNEPFIMCFLPGDKPTCPLCDWVNDDEQLFETQHVRIGTVQKPKWMKEHTDVSQCFLPYKKER